MERNYNRRTEKDYGFIRELYYQMFVWFVAIPISTLMYNIKIEGRENVPKTNRLIIAGNHVSYLDPPLISMAVGKYVAYMAKQELFHDKSKFLAFLVHTLGAFAVNREKPELATFKTVKAIFNTRWCLGIFPQGGIKKEPIIENITKGFVLFSKKAKADVLPVAVCGFDGYAKKLFEKHITIKIGKPISYELDEDEIVQQWAKQICEMTGFEDRINSSEQVAKL